jgi:hypothetical protein
MLRFSPPAAAMVLSQFIDQSHHSPSRYSTLLVLDEKTRRNTDGLFFMHPVLALCDRYGGAP